MEEAEERVPLIDVPQYPRPETSYFDPPSQALLFSLTQKHQTGKVLRDQIVNVERELRNEVIRGHITMKSGLSYEEMMKGLIATDEVLYMNGKPLHYSGVSFDTSPSGSGQSPTLYPGGLLIITNLRLILMSCTIEEGAKLSAYGDPKKLPGGYSVKFKKQDFVWYFPVPLTNVKSAHLYASSTSESAQNIEGSGGGWLCCCFPKVWKPTNRSTISINERKLTLGVVMPPWDKKTDVIVSVDPNVSLIEVQNVIATLQKLCKF